MSPSSSLDGLEGALGLADVAAIRQATYRLFGALFLSPADAERAEALAAAAGELRAEASPVRSFSFFPSWRTVLDSLVLLPGEGTGLLEEEYVRLFRLGPRLPCPPYESAWLDPSGFEHGTLAVEVERAYAEAGVVVSAAGELPDHVALELEFMSVLCGEEAEAWRACDDDRALARLLREETFLGRHLARWFPAFARQVRLAASGASFYRELADAAHAFLVHDRDLIRALTAARSALPTKG